MKDPASKFTPQVFLVKTFTNWKFVFMPRSNTMSSIDHNRPQSAVNAALISQIIHWYTMLRHLLDLFQTSCHWRSKLARLQQVCSTTWFQTLNLTQSNKIAVAENKTLKMCSCQCIYNLWIEFGTAAARRLKQSRANRAIFVWPWNENARTKQKQQTNANRVIWYKRAWLLVG